MDYKVRKKFMTSKIWLIITVFVFAISCIITQASYYNYENKEEIDINALTVYYLVPIVICLISLTFSHFQKYKTGAFFGILVGLNLITNISFTDIIIHSTRIIVTLFEPIFSLLPLLNGSFGEAQFTFINWVASIIQVLYGIFLIIINLTVMLKKDTSPLSKI